MGVGSSVEPGVALGVQQELPVPVVVVVVVAAVGLERASEWLLRVAHLAHSTDALEQDVLAIGAALGPQAGTLGGRRRGVIGADDSLHESPAQQHEQALWSGYP